MAKYRNITTNEVFDSELEAADHICGSNSCSGCCIYNLVNGPCNDENIANVFLKNYLAFGYELVGETSQSNLAKILGVKEDQEWFYGENEAMVYRIHNGKRQHRLKKGWNNTASEENLAEFIKDPSKIHIVNKKQNWTEREIEIARAWKTLNPDMTQFIVNAFSDTEIEIDSVPLKEDPENCPNFFSCNNKLIKVSDILGES